MADKLVHRCTHQVGDHAVEPDFLLVCLFSAIGLVLSLRAVLALDELPEIMAPL